VRSSLTLLLLALAAAPALAQDAEAPDAIGAQLRQSAAPPATPVVLPPPDMPTGAPPPPPPGSLRVDQTGRSPDGPMSETDLAFESRIRQSVAAAQGLQGPLDGQWTLYDAGGRVLYVFLFVDPAGGRGPLEGAWRDPRRPRGSDDLGVVDNLQHAGLTLSLNFVPHPGAAGAAIQLQGQADGRWDGQMTEGGAAQKVSLRRN
jgi:hypothetical protein